MHSQQLTWSEFIVMIYRCWWQKLCPWPPRKEMSSDAHPGQTDPRAHCVPLTLTTRSGDNFGWQKIHFYRTVDLKTEWRNRSEFLEQATTHLVNFRLDTWHVNPALGVDQAGGETELEVHEFGENREKENLAPLPRGGTMEAHGMARLGSI